MATLANGAKLLTKSQRNMSRRQTKKIATLLPQKPKRKTTQLKEMIAAPELCFIMEAHNGLSARIVEETGFKGIWASGLATSASLGVRDCNEASYTQVLDVAEYMADATSVPILLDGDTGYGNFNNARRMVRKLEQRGIAGICIEDKLFPKTNSFIGENQPLADLDEFCGKIQAMKDSQIDADFQVVARVEALISGWPLEEALRRAHAYKRAGADAILIHSKKADHSDIEAFMKEWGNSGPVVIVPTKYYKTPTPVYRDLGISTVIWANHSVRAAITAMQNVCKQIYEQESIKHVEPTIASVSEIFRLQNADELESAEKQYLPAVPSGESVPVEIVVRGEKAQQKKGSKSKILLGNMEFNLGMS